jgi:2-polyprenyl-3-methyl-5-hydroxy-6-metoxy-1,4-benzoquinol methylase
MTNKFLCQICSEASLREVEGYSGLPRITSDCRQFEAGGDLFVCTSCGGVQKLPNSKWLNEINDIYSKYQVYHQSGGVEQIVFDKTVGIPRKRSDVIVSSLLNSGNLPLAGTAIDIGCGNGATLSSMSELLTGWSLNGSELNDEALPLLKKISGFDQLYSENIENIKKQFDLVTMIHSLEHLTNPGGFLKKLHKVVGSGSLFVEVCNIEENPFDILIADHLMHFSPSSLQLLMKNTGYDSYMIETGWVAKEISLLARSDLAASSQIVSAPNPDKIYSRIQSYVSWLSELIVSAREAAKDDALFGFFGTSIAATWLAPQLEDKVSFFVDEDINRLGKTHLGKPIISPSEIPNDSKVFLALAPSVASVIFNRLTKEYGPKFLMPPQLIV